MTEKKLVSKVFKIKNEIAYASDAVVSKTIIKKKAGTISLFAFDKGQGLSEHTAPFDAMVQVVEGTAKVIINRKEHILECCDTIVMPADIPHAIEAVEQFKMLLTMIKGNH